MSDKRSNDNTVTRRRGRGPSKRPCQNRNAQMARQNRLRKKAYLEKIEHKLLYYQQENKNLVNIIRKQSADVRRLSGQHHVGVEAIIGYFTKVIDQLEYTWSHPFVLCPKYLIKNSFSKNQSNPFQPLWNIPYTD
ncbi:hypothetical protein KM043_017568 [Ampulex compressa]|nr:hypothetical protein KM043_017568 [Ampulex compressa]